MQKVNVPRVIQMTKKEFEQKYGSLSELQKKANVQVIQAGGDIENATFKNA